MPYKNSEQLQQVTFVDLGYLSIILAAIAACLFYISPFYEIPQTDDWAYLQSLQYWINAGELKHWGWNDPTLLFQLWWGRIFAESFGLSYSVLRISTLCLFIPAVLAFYCIQTQIEIPRLWASLSSLLLFFNPVALPLAYSFNTDIPYLSVSLLGQLFLLIGLKRNLIGLVCLSGLCFGAAFLLRQTAMLAVLGAVFFLLFYSKLNTARLFSFLLIVPQLAALAVFLYWMSDQAISGWPYAVNNQIVLFQGDTIIFFLKNLLMGGVAFVGLLLTVPFYLSPQAFMLIKSVGLRNSIPSSWKSWLVIGCLTPIFYILWSMAKRWPYYGFHFTEKGILGAESFSFLIPQWALVLCLIFSLWIVWCSLGFLKGKKDYFFSEEGKHVLLFLCIGFFQLVPSLYMKSVFDRYLLVMLPALIVSANFFIRPKGRLVIAIFVLFCLITIECFRSYVDYAKARWSVADELVELGVSPDHIFMGLEWSGEHLYMRAVNELGVRPPLDLTGKGFPWDEIEKKVCRVGEFRDVFFYKTVAKPFYLGEIKVGVNSRGGRQCKKEMGLHNEN